jgi:transcriptional regulator with XRE-family HTH domain
MAEFLNPKFRARLREERERLGYNQKEFAELAGIKRASQYLYENDDESAPNARYFDAIQAMGVDLHYLFFEQRGGARNYSLNPDTVSQIYRIVDEIARDERGKLLPLDARLKFFNLLCAVYSGKAKEEIDLDNVRRFLA